MLVKYAATAGSDQIGTGVVTNYQRGTLDFNGKTDTIGGAVSLYGTSTRAGAITNSGTGGKLTFGGALSFTGGGRIDTGSGTNALGGDVTYSTGADNGMALITGKLDLNATRTFTVADAAGVDPDLLISAAVANGSAASGVTKAGAGRLVLSGTNTFSGTVTINAGTLSVTSGSALPDAGLVSLANVAGAILDVQASETAGALSGGGATGGNVSLAAGVTLTLSSGTQTYSGVLSGGTGALAVNGASQTLSGANTYAGGTTISAGTLTLGNNNRLADSGIVTVDGGTLAIGTYSDTVGPVTLISGTISGSGTLTGTGADYDVRAGSISPILAGTVGLTKTTGGTVTVSGANTYSGNTTISAGMLKLGTASDRIPHGAGKGNVVVDGTLDLAGFSEQINGLSGAGTIDNSTGAATYTLTVGDNNVGGTFSGTITDASGTLALTKIGTATLTLSGTGSYAGTTTISAGTLAVTGGSALPDAGLVSLGNVAGAVLDVQASETAGVLSGGGATGGNVTLGAGITLTLTSGTQTYSGVLSGGTGALAVNGASQTLGNVNTYGGGTTISAGTLTYGAANCLANAGAVTVDGGTLAIGTYNDTVGPVTLISGTISGSGGTLTGSAYDLRSGAISAILGGAGGMTKTTAGTVTLSGVNTFTGPVAVNGGTLSYGAANVLANTVAVTVDSGTLALGVNTDTVGPVTLISGTISGSGTLTGTGADYDVRAGSISPILAGTVGLTKSTGGTVTLSGANTYSGATTISAGTLKLGAANVIPNGATYGNVTVDGTLDLAGFSEQINGLSGAGTIDNSAGAATYTLTVGDNNVGGTFSGTITDASGTLALTKIGTATLTLSGTGSYAGTTTISAGTLAVTGGSALPDSGLVALANVAGAVLDVQAGETAGVLSGGGAAGGNVTLGAGVTLTLTSGTQSYTGVVSGVTGVLLINGANQTLARGQTYAGGTTISAGSLTYGVANCLADTGAVVVNGGTLAIGTYNDIVGAVTLNSGSITGSGGTLTGTVYNVESGSISAILGGPSIALNKSTAGTVTLSGANTYTGTTTVNDGTLALGASGVINNSSPVTVNGGTLSIGAMTETVGAVTLVDGSITGSSGVLTGSSYGVQNGTISAILGGAGGLTKTTGGTVTLSGANTYSGTTAVNAGTLALGTNNVLANTAALTVAGGTFDIGTFNDAVGTVTLTSGTIEGTTGTLTGSVYNVESGAINAKLGGSGIALNKTTIGTVALNSTNTYTGATAINGGTLRVEGETAAGSAVAVNSGGTLTGTGVLGGAVTVNNGGTLRPGTSVGTLNMGSLTLNAGSTNVLEFNVSPANDQVLVSGTLTVNGGGMYLYQEGTTTAWSQDGTYQLMQYGSFAGVAANLTVLNPQPAKQYSFEAAGGWLTLRISSGSTWDGGDADDSLWTSDTNWAGDGGTAAGAELYFGGVLRLDNTNDFPAGTAFAGITFLNSGGAFTLNGNAVNLTANVINSNALAQTIALPLVLDSNNRTFNAVAGDITVSGPISDGGATWGITKSGGYKLVLAGANAYDGLTTISAGALNARNDDALGSVVNGTVVPAGTALELQGGISVGAEALSVAGTGIGGGGALRNVADTNTYGGAITLTNATTVSVDADDLTLSNTLGGGYVLSKIGSGRLILSANNAAFTGGVSNRVGVLSVRNGGALGGTATGTVVVSGSALEIEGGISVGAEPLSIAGSGIGGAGALRNVTDTNAFGGAVTLTNRTTIGVDAGDLTLSGAVSGGYVLNKVGAGRLILSANNSSFTGGITNETGVLSIRNGGALGTTSTGTVVISGAALELQGNVTVGAEPLSIAGTGVAGNGAIRNIQDVNTYGGTVTLTAPAAIQSDAGTLTLNASTAVSGGGNGVTLQGTGSGTIGGVITGAGTTLTKAGSGTWMLDASSADNTFTGVTTVNGGTLILSHTAGYDAIGDLLAIGDGIGSDTVQLAAANQMPDTCVAAVNGGGVLDFNSQSDTIRSLSLNSGGTLISGGAMTLTLNGTAAPVVSVQAGSTVGSNVGLSFSGTADITALVFDPLTSGSAAINSAVNLNSSGTANRDRTLAISNGTVEVDLDLGGVQSSGSAVDLIKTEAGTLQFSGSSANTFTGTLRINDGALYLNKSGTAKALADSCALTIGDTIASPPAALIKYVGASSDMAGNGAVTINKSGTLDFNGKTDTLGGAFTLNGTSTQAGAITNSGTNGKLTFGSTLAFTGGGRLDTGSGTNALGGDVTYSTGADNATALINGNLDLNATRTFTVADAAGVDPDLLIAAVVANGSAASGLTKAGAGRLALAGTNTYSGTTTINAGVLAIRSNGALGTTAGNTTISAGALELEGGLSLAEPFSLAGAGIAGNGALRSLSGVNVCMGTVALAANATVGVDAGSLTLTNAITGAYVLSKTGSGTLVLRGPNTYSGGTTISNGVLQADHAANSVGTGALSVQPGATLAGSGTVRGAVSTVTVGAGSANNGHLSPGAGAAGTLTISNTLALANSTFLDMDLGVPGGDDLVDVKGQAGNNGNLTIGTDVTVAVSPGASWDNGTYRLIHYTGTLTDNSSGFSGWTVSGSGLGAREYTFRVNGAYIEMVVRPLTVWDGDLSTDWSNSANWLGGTAPVDGDVVSLTHTSSFDAVNLDIAGLDLTRIIWDATADTAYTITNLAIGLSEGLTLDADAADQGIAVDIVLSAAQAWQVGTGRTLTASGGLSGNGAPTKTGAGTLVLSGANSYVGATTNAAGAISIRSDTALGSAVGGTVVAGGAALELQGGISVGAEALSIAGTGIGGGALRNVADDNTYGGTVTLTGNTRVAVDADELALTNTIAGGYALTKAGSGTLVLSGANAYTGATTNETGVLNIRHAAALGTTAGGTVVANGAALELQGGISVGNEALSIAGTGVAGGGALRNVGGANTYAGAVALTNNALVSVAAGQLSLTNVISGGYALNKTGTGTLVLSGPNTYSGATTNLDGTLRGALSANALGSGPLTLAAGILELANNTALDFGRNTTVSGYAAIVSDRVTAGGGVTHSLGTLAIGASTLAVRAGSFVTSGTAGLAFDGVTLSGSPTFSIENPAVGLTLLTLGAITNGAQTVTLTGTGNFTQTGVWGNGAGGLTLDAAYSGTGTLSQANSFTGPVAINGGTLALGASGVLQNSVAVTVNGGTLSIGANTESVGTVTLLSGTITGTSGELRGSSYDVRSGTLGAILGTAGASLTKSTAGTVVMTKANVYTGTTTINAGTLTVNNPGSLAAGSAVTVQTGGTLGGNGTVNGTVTTVSSGVGAANNGHLAPGDTGAGTLNSGALTLGNNSFLDYDLGSPVSDLVNVTGNLTLGTNVTLNVLSGAAPGTYHLIQFSGTLTGQANLATWTATGAPGNAFFFRNGSYIDVTLDMTMIVTLPGETFVAGVGNTGTPTAQTAGIPFNLTKLTVIDHNTNIVTAFAGTKTIAYSGPGGNTTFTTSVVFSAGQSTTILTTKLYRAETTTITATEGTVQGAASSPLTVNAGAFMKLQLLVPGESASPGTTTGKTGTPDGQNTDTAFDVTVNAVDTNWNVVGTVGDTVSITSSDPNATLPPNAALAGGTQLFNFKFNTAGGTRTITATDVTDMGKTANTSPPISVGVGAFVKLQLLMPGEAAAPGTPTGKTGGPTPRTAGYAFNMTVNAVDASWNIVNTITHTVGITSSDANAALPPNAALVTGTNRFSLTFKTAGSWTATATNITDGTKLSDTSPLTVVNPGPFVKMQLLVPGEAAAPGTASGKTGTPTAQTAGTAFDVTVSAVDTNWNMVSTNDIVGIRSSDTNAVLPANAALVGGTQDFTLTLRTAGSRTVTATNITNGAKTSNTSPAITVNPGPFTQVLVIMPGQTAAPGTATGRTGTPTAQTAGVAFGGVGVRAVDDCWNLINTVTDTVQIYASSDPLAVLPAPAALVNGTNYFGVTFKTTGSQTLTAKDVTTVKIENTGSATTVNPAGMHHYEISVTPPLYAATAFTTTVSAVDIFTNPVPSYGATATMSGTGHVQFDSNGNGVYGDNSKTFTGGSFTIATKDNSAETVNLMVSDSNSKTGLLTGVVINPVIGSYRTAASGDWTNAATWETFNGAAWIPASSAPNSTAAPPILVCSSHTATVTANVTVDQVTVETNGQLVVAGGQTMAIANGADVDLDVFGTLTVAGALNVSNSADVVVETGGQAQDSGLIDLRGTLTMNTGGNAAVNSGGTLRNAGTINCTASTLRFNAGGTYQHNYTTTPGDIPIATWNAGSTCEVIGYTTYNNDNGFTWIDGLTQPFANFTWNCSNQLGIITLIGALNTVNGDFTVMRTGTNYMRLGYNAPGNLSVGGNFLQSGGFFRLSGIEPRNVTVGGNFTLTGGTLDVSYGSDTLVNFLLSSNFTHTGGTLTQIGSGLNAKIAFNGTLPQYYTSGGTVVGQVNFSVYTNAILVVGTNLVGVGSTGSFTVAPGGTLAVGDPAGITLSGATGNVRVAGTRTYSSSGSYIYNGHVAQATGNGLSGARNLTITNAAGVSLSGSVTVIGTLALADGRLTTGTNVIHVANTSNSAITGAGATRYIIGSLRKTFGTAGNPQAFTFPIGDATQYAPLDLAAMTVSSAGALTASTTAGDHPQVGWSGIDNTLSVNRHWALSTNGAPAAVYSATFNYASGEVDGAALPPSFIVRRYDAGAWQSATVSGTPTSTNTTISGETGFGEFAIGDAYFPRLSIDDTVVFEPAAGTTDAVFTVSMRLPFSENVDVQFASSNGTAIAGSDYEPTNGTVTLSIGATSAEIRVIVNADLNPESAIETYEVHISTTNAFATVEDDVGQGSIIDILSLSIGDTAVVEGDSGTTNAVFEVSLPVATPLPVQFSYATSNGTAKAGSDFTAMSGTGTIAAGNSSTTLTVVVFGDTTFEPDETFTLRLTNAVNAVIEDGVGVGTILNDDPFEGTLFRFR